MMSQYHFKLSDSSEFYMYQPQIDVILSQQYKNNGVITSRDFDFVAMPVDQDRLFDELKDSVTLLKNWMGTIML